MTVIPYNRLAALYYAQRWALSRNLVYYDYSLIGGDCTNFASQTVYAGCGVMNYSENGWYYINSNEKSPSWTGVEFFYNFMINNKDEGPFAEERELKFLVPGDIIQFGDANSNYYHTVILTNIVRYRNRTNYYVSAHSVDAYRKNLFSYNFEKYRGIHILGARISDSYSN